MRQDLINESVEIAKAEITFDINEGIIPEDVTSFGELHDYVDANTYGEWCDDENDMTFDEVNAAQELVHQWITRGRK